MLARSRPWALIHKAVVALVALPECGMAFPVSPSFREVIKNEKTQAELGSSVHSGIDAMNLV